jgi:hypothetical protein
MLHLKKRETHYCNGTVTWMEFRERILSNSLHSFQKGVNLLLLRTAKSLKKESIYDNPWRVLQNMGGGIF